MWWNIYTEFSRRVANQFTELLAPPEPKPSSSGRSAHLDAMIQQISEDIAHMTDLERENVKAEIALHAREWCLKDISHDLRTPLNAIIGFTQMMENGLFGPVANPQYLEYLRHIRESGYELLDKVEDLMETVNHQPVKPRATGHRKETIRLKEAVA